MIIPNSKQLSFSITKRIRSLHLVSNELINSTKRHRPAATLPASETDETETFSREFPKNPRRQASINHRAGLALRGSAGRGLEFPVFGRQSLSLRVSRRGNYIRAATPALTGARSAVSRRTTLTRHRRVPVPRDGNTERGGEAWVLGAGRGGETRRRMKLDPSVAGINCERGRFAPCRVAAAFYRARVAEEDRGARASAAAKFVAGDD